MNRKYYIPALIMAAGVVTAGGLTFAKQFDAENESSADFAKATISLSQAVSAAEAQAGGKASKAEFASERGALVYEVEIVTADSKVFDVKVDATNGKVLSSKLDQADRGEKEDNDD